MLFRFINFVLLEMIKIYKLGELLPDMRRKKRKFDPTKNRKLDEFLSNLEIDDSKKEQILEFVEELTFQKVKEASIGKKKESVLRLVK